MKIRPENWLLNKTKDILLNIDDGKTIKKIKDIDENFYFEICNNASDPSGYCKIVNSSYKIANTEAYAFYVDDILYAKLSRIFEDGFDYSDYNLY